AVAAALETRSWRIGARILALGLLGAAVAVVVYYRDFLGSAAALAPRIVSGTAGAAAAGSRYPVESWLALTYARTRDFFGWTLTPLAIAGLFVALRRARARVVLA